MEDDKKKEKKGREKKKKKKKWKTNQSTKINLISCDTIVNSPSICLICNEISYDFHSYFLDFEINILIIKYHPRM